MDAIRTNSWKPLVISVRPEIHARLQTAFAQLGIEQPAMVAEYLRAPAIQAVVRRNNNNVCFLDATFNPEGAASLIGELASTLPVVSLLDRNDGDLILRLLRRGACEFLADPAPDALGAVLDRLSRVSAAAAPRAMGRVYCVAPVKPGCGASTLAAHLAIRMRSDGVEPALLVDADERTSSIAFMLQIKAQFHLEDVLRDWERMDDEMWSRLTVAAYGLDVLAAPDDPATKIQITRQFAEQACAFWRERYRAVVIDLPDVRAAADYGFFAAADVNLLVTTNELAALHATGRGLRYLDSAAANRSKLRLIVNRYLPAAGPSQHQIRAAVGLEPFALVVNDYAAIQTALVAGKPVPSTSKFGASVRALCRKISDNPSTVEKSGSWLRNLLSAK